MSVCTQLTNILVSKKLHICKNILLSYPSSCTDVNCLFPKDFTITAPCKETLDVGFVIDASGSVGLDTFSREKNFVKLVSRRIAASSSDTRLGLMVFSDTPKLFVDFGDYQRMTIDQFQTTVDQVPFQGGRSRIDLALRAASQDFFTNRRSGVPRVSKKNKI